VRETFGVDELLAKQLADAKGGTVTDMLTRLAVVEHDGTLVEQQPFSAFDAWNSRTRAFVFAAWRKINALPLAACKLVVAQSKPHAKIPGAFVFDCSMLDGLDCKSFSLRETSGEDELQGARASDRTGAGVVAEMVKLSIAEVDGVEADDDTRRRYDREWSTRSRGLVLFAWQAINSVVDGEVDDFLTSEAAPLPPSQATTSSGASGDRG
jgi:hypothetical protein